ncbi:hypothetical protein BH10PLA2_BH10PLA2_26980 [soil metagenome]
MMRHLAKVLGHLYQCGICQAEFDNHTEFVKHLLGHGDGRFVRCYVNWRGHGTK